MKRYKTQENALVLKTSFDTSHEQEVLWGATSVQPQWESIVQQAYNEEQISHEH